MSETMCVACSLRALDAKLGYIRAERERWEQEEQRAQADIRAEEDRIEQEFDSLGYDPD